MDIKKTLFGVGTVILFIGFFFAFLPHTAHTSIGLGSETSHVKHVIIGSILILIGIVILILTEKK